MKDSTCMYGEISTVYAATNTISEWSALVIRQIKIYLRTSMTQPRLNQMTVLHIHRHLINKISYAVVLNEFVFANDQ